MSLHHISLPISPSAYKPMRDFYLATLGPLGYTPFKEHEGVFCGLRARNMSPDFWLHCGGDDSESKLTRADPTLSADENRKVLGHRTHVAFGVCSRREVESWYRAAMYVFFHTHTPSSTARLNWPVQLLT